MGLAFATVAFLLLLLPGVAARRFYFAEQFSKEFNRGSFNEEFLSAFVPAVGIHIALLGASRPLGVPGISLTDATALLSGAPTESSVRALDASLPWVTLYMLMSTFLGAGLGYVFGRSVRARQLDRKHKFFRFRNTWHYLFRAEVADFPRADFKLSDSEPSDLDFVLVDAVVGLGPDAVLYEGALVDYELGPQAQLATITLRDARRRVLRDDDDGQRERDARYYDIEGHLLVLRYADITSVNLKFYRLAYAYDETGQPVSVTMQPLR